MELSRDARILFALIFVLFLQSYLSGNVLPSLLGIGVLSYILFCRSSFAAAVDSQDVNIQRNIQKKTYFAKEPVRVSVSYSYPFTDEVFLEIKDRIPKDSFVLEGSNVHTDVVSSLRGIEYSYDLVRESRGTAVFEAIETNVVDKRGLFMFQRGYDLRNEITYQDSRDRIKRADYIAKGSSREELVEEETVLTTGMDFAGIREYQPGDRISDIDWKASSRLQKLLTKLSEAEGYGSIYVLLDVSRSMRATYGDRSKFNHSILLTMQLTKIFLEHENPTGFIAFDEHTVVENVPAFFNRGQYSTILSSLERLPDTYRATYPLDPRYEQDALDEESKEFLGKVLPYLSGSRRAVKSIMGVSGLYSTVMAMGEKYEKSLMLVISDLESNSKALIDTIKMISSRGGEVLLITPYSPWYDMDISSMDIKTAEGLYKNYLTKRRNMSTMRNVGVRIIEETPEDTLSIIYPKIKGELS